MSNEPEKIFLTPRLTNAVGPSFCLCPRLIPRFPNNIFGNVLGVCGTVEKLNMLEPPDLPLSPEKPDVPDVPLIELVPDGPLLDEPIKLDDRLEGLLIPDKILLLEVELLPLFPLRPESPEILLILLNPDDFEPPDFEILLEADLPLGLLVKDKPEDVSDLLLTIDFEVEGLPDIIERLLGPPILDITDCDLDGAPDLK